MTNKRDSLQMKIYQKTIKNIKYDMYGNRQKPKTFENPSALYDNVKAHIINPGKKKRGGRGGGGVNKRQKASVHTFSSALYVT